MLDPRARPRLCPRLPHLRRPRRRIAHVDGHVPDDGSGQLQHPRLHRSEHARDVLRPLGYARRPRRDELRQFQLCRVRAVHCPVRRVRAARRCARSDYPLPEVVIPYPLGAGWTSTIYSYIFCVVFVDDLFCVISRTWAHLRTNTGFAAEWILPITPILHFTPHSLPNPIQPLIDSALFFITID